MHSSKPYGLLSVNGEITQADQLFIDNELKRFNNRMDLSQLESFRYVKNLPDGGYCVFQNMAGLLKAIVNKQKPIDEIEQSFDGIAKLYTPMLYSGTITRAMVEREGGKVGLKLTEHTRRRVTNYQYKLEYKDIQLERFKVEYSDKFKYFEPRLENRYFYSQYHKLKPTWYSGAMAEVIQIISGFGRQDTNNLPDHPLERTALNLPPEFVADIATALEGVRLPGYTGMPDMEGKIHLDYKASDARAVCFGQDNTPWLIKIDATGVWAMPLPLIPATTTHAFREYMEIVADDEILTILDRFGGIPSGEDFPDNLHAWHRAGVVIKVCDTADFYQYSPMYEACGWSFNSSGSHGFNTCYGFNEQNLMQAYGYEITLRLGAVVDQGYIKPQQADPQNAQVLSMYMGQLQNLLSYDSKGLAILYKVRKVPQEELAERARSAIYGSGLTQSEVDYWDNYIVDPIANHAGRVVRISSGAVYWPLGKTVPTSMGALKFPELTGQGCQSFMFSSPDYEGGFVRCDTIMFGAYIEDQLKVVRYFYDERKFIKEKESTFEDVMIIGSWEETTTTGQTGLAGYFYTSDFDDRKELSPSTTYTKIKGSDLGFGAPLYVTPGLLVTTGSLGRARYYKHEVLSETVSGMGLSIGVCIPAYNRDAILYAYQESAQSVTNTEEHRRLAVADPTSYMLWTYDPIFHYMGGVGKGEPRPTHGEYVYVSGPPNYSPNEYSDFADQGDWFGVGNNYINVTSVCGPYTDRNSGNFYAMGVSIGGEAPTITPVNTTETKRNVSTGFLNVSIAGMSATNVHKRLADAWYFTFSPVESSGMPLYFYRDACKVLFGQTTYTNISELDGELRFKRGYSALVDHKSMHHFIGVINE